MSFALIASSNGGATSAAGTSHTINVPSGIVSGNLLIAVTVFDGTPTISDWPAGWTEIYGLNSGTAIRGEARYRVATGGESNFSLTSSVSENSAHQSYRITGFSGTPEDDETTGFSNTPDGTLLTPSWGADDTLWIALSSHDVQTVSAIPDPPYTSIRAEDHSSDAGGNVGIQGIYRNLNATSETPGDFTLSGADDWITATIGIQPGAAGVSLVKLINEGMNVAGASSRQSIPIVGS